MQIYGIWAFLYVTSLLALMCVCVCYFYITALTVQIWNMMEGKDLFTNLKDEQGHYNSHAHLAQMIALLGPPPLALLERERNFRKLTFTPEIRIPKDSCAGTHSSTLADHSSMTMVRCTCASPIVDLAY